MKIANASECKLIAKLPSDASEKGLIIQGARANVRDKNQGDAARQDEQKRSHRIFHLKARFSRYSIEWNGKAALLYTSEIVFLLEFVYVWNLVGNGSKKWLKFVYV